ncbi:hypothetical protein F5883DRAFT_59845 [Diaporthe sp. PMI_573]|nr:hypothetical protein F5883DRAFT_59845 [Diaporthaceae sp. PMI_573]
MLGLCVTSALLVAGDAMRHGTCPRASPVRIRGHCQAAEVEPSCSQGDLGVPTHDRPRTQAHGSAQMPGKMEILGHAPLGTPWGFETMWSIVGVGMMVANAKCAGGKWLDWTGRTG